MSEGLNVVERAGLGLVVGTFASAGLVGLITHNATSANAPLPPATKGCTNYITDFNPYQLVTYGAIHAHSYVIATDQTFIPYPSKTEFKAAHQVQPIPTTSAELRGLLPLGLLVDGAVTYGVIKKTGEWARNRRRNHLRLVV